ncbi:hypothetical protein [Hyalangium rubrum]|uniref:Uncharacterized protein n=1 Tax=Hyalangium rubrum TaxID=3103134 RepID=A0ABU5H072_9BACT|nr:hypothetical protein [Hyalangium sp. s54d21]MDY7226853.1 hypothetical protein [Hyalangium sp. s54d21]
MSHPRLVLFLSDVEGNLTALRQSLRRVCEELGLPTPEVKWAQAPNGLTDAGWHVAEVPLAPDRKGKEGQLEEHLDKVTQALSQDFRDRALSLYADRGNSYARVCVAGPGKPSKALEGEFIDVLRQTAKWLDVETTVLARLLGNNPARNLLAAAVDFGEDAKARGEQPPPPPEPDEEDRFVEAKLSEARVLMEQYLSSTRK